jgi:uncharacterized OsmC-like protein
MTDAATIKKANDRIRKALELRPAKGLGTSITTARLIDGLACEIRQGEWMFKVDMGKPEGGDGTAPSPGFFGRGALAGCLAIGIAIVSAQRGITVKGLSVEVAADWDWQGFYGLGENVPPGYTAVRVLVDIDSPAPREDLEAMFEEAVAHSSYVDVFRRSNDVTVTLRGDP